MSKIKGINRAKLKLYQNRFNSLSMYSSPIRLSSLNIYNSLNRVNSTTNLISIVISITISHNLNSKTTINTSLINSLSFPKPDQPTIPQWKPK